MINRRTKVEIFEEIRINFIENSEIKSFSVKDIERKTNAGNGTIKKILEFYVARKKLDYLKKLQIYTKKQ